MLSVEVQAKLRESIRQLDHMLVTTIERDERLVQTGINFRDTFFAAFGFVETESLSMKELQVTLKRMDRQQLEVIVQRRISFMLQFDPELAYDVRPVAAEGQEGRSETKLELGSRLFVVLAPPQIGLIRHYTIFGDGAWKRTTFNLTPQGVQARQAFIPRSTSELLIHEAIDLVRYACQIYPMWQPMTDKVQEIGLSEVRKRAVVKQHMTGLAGIRRASS